MNITSAKTKLFFKSIFSQLHNFIYSKEYILSTREQQVLLKHAIGETSAEKIIHPTTEETIVKKGEKLTPEKLFAVLEAFNTNSNILIASTKRRIKRANEL